MVWPALRMESSSGACGVPYGEGEGEGALASPAGDGEGRLPDGEGWAPPVSPESAFGDDEGLADGAPGVKPGVGPASRPSKAEMDTRPGMMT